MNSTSFLHGTNPAVSSVPVYALVSLCSKKHSGNDGTGTSDESIPQFYVTYWMFYPYSKGKPICMVDMGLLGTWPLPDINGQCLGIAEEYGSHVGDWEHVSLMFQKMNNPDVMYVSAHTAGAYYRFNPETHIFEYDRQDARSVVLQRPNFPTTGNISSSGDHPVLFAARGSHGLWTAPGRHTYVRVLRLYDDTGYGVPWRTWESIQVMYSNSTMLPSWMKFRGRWGNPRSQCNHPLTMLGPGLCKYSDGPTGIPRKRLNFKCP